MKCIRNISVKYYYWNINIIIFYPYINIFIALITCMNKQHIWSMNKAHKHLLVNIIWSINQIYKILIISKNIILNRYSSFALSMKSHFIREISFKQYIQQSRFTLNLGKSMISKSKWKYSERFITDPVMILKKINWKVIYY